MLVNITGYRFNPSKVVRLDGDEFKGTDIVFEGANGVIVVNLHVDLEPAEVMSIINQAEIDFIAQCYVRAGQLTRPVITSNQVPVITSEQASAVGASIMKDIARRNRAMMVAKADEDHKPCPFCGGNDLSLCKSGSKDLYVRCRDCGTEGPSTGSGVGAWGLWNKRFDPDCDKNLKEPETLDDLFPQKDTPVKQEVPPQKVKKPGFPAFQQAAMNKELFELKNFILQVISEEQEVEEDDVIVSIVVDDDNNAFYRIVLRGIEPCEEYVTDHLRKAGYTEFHLTTEGYSA